MPCDNFRFGRQRLESEGTTDEPQRTHFLFSRTYACRIGRLLQWATSQRSQESRDRADGLICPSCGQNYADLIGRHCLILVMDVRAPWCECRDGAQVPLLDVMVASGASPAVAWEKWQAAASISVADEVWWQTTIAFERDVIGTGPANFTGLLSALERP